MPASAATGPLGERDRFGVVLAGKARPGDTAQVRLDRVGVRWYYDYSPVVDDELPGYHKLGMLRGGESNRPDLNLVNAQARSKPGHAWLIFNEPDLDGQDRVSDAFLASRGETRAQYYARLIHTYNVTLKSADPSALLIGPNLFNAGGQARAWLTDVRRAYAAEFGADLPFDIIGVHLYAFDPTWNRLPQIDLVQNERYLADTLQFAAELPSQPKVWVTEYGSMWIYTTKQCGQSSIGFRCSGENPAWGQVSDYISQMVQDMSAAGVERWFMFSDSPVADPWSSVFNATYLSTQDGALTPLGQAWLNLSVSPTDANWSARVLNIPASPIQ